MGRDKKKKNGRSSEREKGKKGKVEKSE